MTYYFMLGLLFIACIDLVGLVAYATYAALTELSRRRHARTVKEVRGIHATNGHDRDILWTVGDEAVIGPGVTIVECK